MRRAIALSAMLLLAAGCSDKPTNGNNAQQAANTPSVLVEVAPAARAPVSKILTAYGTVEFSPEGARVITVQAEQVVARLLVTVGQPVKPGQSLLTLEPSASARLALDNAKIDVEFARKEARRLADLRNRQLATNAEVQAAEKNLATVEAALANILRRGGGGGPKVVRSDVAGTVQAVNVQLGQVVTPGAPLLTIGNSDRARVKLGVEQDDLLQVRIGQRVMVRPLNSSEPPIASRIAEIFRHIDPRTRLAEVVIPLPPSHGLLPGAAVRAEITLQAKPDALVVPRSAVLYHQGTPYVFVVDRGRASERIVDTGVDTGKVIEILKGLTPGQSVVTAGNAELNDGMPVRTEPGK